MKGPYDSKREEEDAGLSYSLMSSIGRNRKRCLIANVIVLFGIGLTYRMIFQGSNGLEKCEFEGLKAI